MEGLMKIDVHARDFEVADGQREHVPHRPGIYKLTVMHGKLDDAIRHEHKRPFPDGIKLLRLKTLKLAVKDRLQLLVRFGQEERA
jgi:hypothetical protein